MSDNGKNYYDADYYKSHCGEDYERGHGWEETFGDYADRIIKEINPHKTLDVGCAKGYMVEALRDRGVEAYGIDVSEYAVSEARKDIEPYCRVQSVLHPLEEKYDLITCIEVLEHLDNKDIPLAIQRMCEAADDILFSSTPFDYTEESHVSVHAPEYWAEQFAYNGFYHDVQYDCSYISVQAMRFRKIEKSKTDLIREYEREMFQNHQELVAMRQRCKLSEENVQIYKDAYQRHVDMINEELNPRICELEQILSDKEKEETENLSKLRREVEEHCLTQMENELRKRKYFEEQYYYYQEKYQKAEANRKELREAYNNVLSSFAGMSLRGMLKKWCKERYRERKLLWKKAEYWEPVFDAQYYAEHNKDIYDMYGMNKKALLKHFVQHGMLEGRAASSEFDINAYLTYNEDVAEMCMQNKKAGYMHYLSAGRLEGRRTR